MIDLKYTEMSINLTVPWYLLASYAYYKDDDPIISDSAYDGLSTYMLNNWKRIKHPHKTLIKKGDLDAGTFLGDYPSIVQSALKKVREAKYDRFPVYQGLPFD
jgi:hypothetical protein